MAKHSSHILELAARGAKARYDELQAEIASLVRHFPNLRRRAGQVVRRGRKAVAAAAQELTPRKRRKMSAQARKAVSARMKKYWAARRKSKAAAK